MGSFFKELLLFLQEKGFPLPYKVAAVVVAACLLFDRFPGVKEFMYGPEWMYEYEVESETAAFKTDSKLKSGQLTVRFQYEMEYKEKIFYILEVQGVYNINHAGLKNNETDDLNGNDGAQESEICLTLEKPQKDKLDTFKKFFKDFLEEHLKEYKDDFRSEEFTINERQVAAISYQTFKMNRSLPMYLLVSGEEVRTILEKEADARRPHASINIDEINLDESFYTNEEIMKIVKDCCEK